MSLPLCSTPEKLKNITILWQRFWHFYKQVCQESQDHAINYDECQFKYSIHAWRFGFVSAGTCLIFIRIKLKILSKVVPIDPIKRHKPFRLFQTLSCNNSQTVLPTAMQSPMTRGFPRVVLGHFLEWIRLNIQHLHSKVHSTFCN